MNEHSPLTPDLPFDALLDRAKRLDQAALAAIYRRHMPVVYRYVAARVTNVQQVEDITADTMLAILHGVKSVRAQDEISFVGWALTIARNRIFAHFRWLRLHPEISIEAHEMNSPGVGALPRMVAEQANPLTIMIAREEWSEVVEALDQLTDVQREVVFYRCVLGYSATEVARLLDKHPDAIRALQHRALTSLARLLRARAHGVVQRGKEG